MCINAISEVELCQKKYIQSYQKYTENKLMDYSSREIGVYEFLIRNECLLNFTLFLYQGYEGNCNKEFCDCQEKR